MSEDPVSAQETIKELRRKIADYERWFQQLDSQMRLLERERQKLSAVVTYSDAGFVVFDSSMEVVWSNDIFSQKFDGGGNPSDLAGRTCNKILCREKAECETCPLPGIFQSGGIAHHEIELIIDGKERHIYATAMPIKSPEGRVEQAIVMLQDVSDLQILRRSEEALRASEARFRSIFEKTTAGMASVAANGSFLQVNPAFCAFLGYGENELLSMTVQGVTHPEDLPATERTFGKGRPRYVDLEKRYVRKDGATVWGRTSAAWILDSAGVPEYSVAMVQDITERKSLERDLRQAEKMSAVGQLIAGVAHELNNPLAGVLGYSQLLLEMPVDERIRRGLDSINKEADRCKKIVYNLQTFARKHKPEVEAVSINSILMSSLELRSYQMKVDDIRVVTQLTDDLPATMADSHQLRQVFLNVIINAHQAMSLHQGKGTLILRSRLENQEVRVDIQDDGPGIKETDLGKIFDPFFTTKEVGQGTGLGLSICYGIMEEHGGRIEGTNAPDGGAIFTISFPVRSCTKAAVERVQKPPEPARKAAAGAKVLVVDDEESIGDVLKESLTMAGHQVDVSRNGVEALERMDSVTYDAVISDLKMPGMGGEELYDNVMSRHPIMAGRMLFSTGDTVSRETADFLERTGVRCVQKPFDLEEMRRLVDEVLSVPVA